MLDGVVDRYLDTVTEREFDAPLLALLFAHGFTDIHQLHGAFEFGKDFIAKRTDHGRLRQYALQSKAGDLNLSGWRSVRCTRTSTGTCPGRRSWSPRAGSSAGPRCRRRSTTPGSNGTGSPASPSGTGNTLRPMLATHPACGLAGGSPGDLLALLGGIDQGRTDQANVERYTRRWAAASLQQVAVESAVVGNRLRTNRRWDLAATTALAALRAAVCQYAEPGSTELGRAARRLHAAYATGLLDRYEAAAGDPMELMKLIAPGFVHVTYPAICLRLAEIWGLLGIAPHAGAATAARARAATAALLTRQPGAAHPLSDRWAASLVPAVLSLAVSEPAAIDGYLRTVVQWTADAYDHGLGLAGVTATPAEEVTVLFGPELEHVTTARATTSYTATVLVDLAAAAGLVDAYEFALNELLAAGARPTLMVADESRAAWGAAAEGLQAVPVVRYREPWTADSALAAHHHAPATTGVDTWDALALCTLPRNRHAWWAIRRTLAGSVRATTGASPG